MKKRHIAPFILEKEYRCKCCGKLPFDFYNDEELGEINIPYVVLFNNFERIRKEYGKPIPLSSCYRCEKRNKEEGGIDLSIHLWGLALDLDVETVGDVNALNIIVRKLFPEMRMGIYTSKGTFIHLDVAYLILPRASEKWHKGARWYG